LKSGKLTNNKFLEDVDIITEDHCSIQLNNVWMFQATPNLQLVGIEIQDIYLNHDKKNSVSEKNTLMHTHTHLTALSRYQKGKTNLDFTEARDSEWQWHQLGDMQVCTLLQTDNHASTPPLR